MSACTPDAVVQTENIPTAGVRFINAVPDTAGAFGMDLRFVDILESNAHYRITFRNGPSAKSPFVSTTIEFKGARAGSRRFRIFLDDTVQSVASTALYDTTVALTATHNYSAFLWGNARSAAADKMHLSFLDEVISNTDTTLVALRVVNATQNPIDVTTYVQGTTPPVVPTWAAVPAFSASSYIYVAPATMMYNVKPAGGAVALFADAQAMPGAPANCDLHFPCLPGEQPDIEAAPGTTVAGSGVSAIVFPSSSAGARTPQTAPFTVPAITFMWDRRPPRGCKPVLCG